MALHLLNLKDPVPDEFIGVYDIVHIRNFSFVLMDEEIPLVLDHLIQMLSKYQLQTEVLLLLLTYADCLCVQ